MHACYAKLPNGRELKFAPENHPKYLNGFFFRNGFFRSAARWVLRCTVLRDLFADNCKVLTLARTVHSSNQTGSRAVACM